MTRSARGLLLILPLALGGCIGTVATVATAPFKVAGKAVGYATSGQARSDRAYGRKMRKQEEREGKARREKVARCRHHPADPDCAAPGTPGMLDD